MCCRRRTKTIGGTGRAKNEVLHGVKEERTSHYNKKKERTRHILRANCLLNYVIEGKLDRKRRSRKQLLVELKGKRRH